MMVRVSKTLIFISYALFASLYVFGTSLTQRTGNRIYEIPGDYQCWKAQGNNFENPRSRDLFFGSGLVARKILELTRDSRQGESRQGESRQGESRQGESRQGESRQRVIQELTEVAEERTQELPREVEQELTPELRLDLMQQYTEAVREYTQIVRHLTTLTLATRPGTINRQRCQEILSPEAISDRGIINVITPSGIHEEWYFQCHTGKVCRDDQGWVYCASIEEGQGEDQDESSRPHKRPRTSSQGYISAPDYMQ